MKKVIQANPDQPNESCWFWIGYCDRPGYGQVRWHGHRTSPHRVSYTQLIGLIPDGLELDHLCRVRNCVNPLHLEPVSHAENMRRGTPGIHQRAKTHCPRGHIYAEGKRVCFVCPAEQKKRYDIQHVARLAAGDTRIRNSGAGKHNREKTHCLRGHEFTPNNTYMTKAGRRLCKACKNERQRRARR